MTFSRRTYLLLAAVIGVCVLGFLGLSRVPPRGKPKQLIQRWAIYNRNCGLVEGEDVSNYKGSTEGLRCDVFLISKTALTEPVVEGANIKCYLNTQRNSYDIAGDGRIRSNGRIIEVTPSAIIISGVPVRRGTKAVVIEPDGSFKEDQFVGTH